MPRVLDPIQFVLIALAGWMNHRHLKMIEYLREENRVLREQLGDRRVRFNDDQRRRLAAKAKGLGRRRLAEVATLVTPDTLLAWHRKLGRSEPGRGIVQATRDDIEFAISTEPSVFAMKIASEALSNSDRKRCSLLRNCFSARRRSPISVPNPINSRAEPSGFLTQLTEISASRIEPSFRMNRFSRWY